MAHGQRGSSSPYSLEPPDSFPSRRKPYLVRPGFRRTKGRGRPHLRAGSPGAGFRDVCEDIYGEGFTLPFRCSFLLCGTVSLSPGAWGPMEFLVPASKSKACLLRQLSSTCLQLPLCNVRRDKSLSLRAAPRGCSISPIFHTPSGCVSAVGEVVLFLSRKQAYKYVRGAQKHFRVSVEGRLGVSVREHGN